jgi:hypothetical protein
VGVRVVLGALLALVLIVSGCSSSNGDDGATTSIAASATTATTVATTATTTAGAATGPLELVGTYDGENCSYEGPETATLDDEISLTLVNDSADAAGLVLVLIPPDRLTDFEPLVGSDTDFSGETFLQPTFYAESGPFAESSVRSFLPAPGTYVVECSSGGVPPTHVWWLAALEVNP